jgi:hexokinase
MMPQIPAGPAALDRFLRDIGMTVSAVDLDRVLEDFRFEMEAGLAGRPSSLAMIPTFIPPPPPIPANRTVIALDAGGTHLRVATVRFEAGGSPCIEHFARYPMPGSDKEVSADEFYQRFVEILLPLAGEAKQVGFCFSYPAEISPDRDGRLMTWSKEIRAPEVVGQRIGKNIFDRLRREGHDLSFVLLNDTVAALLAGKSAEGGAGFDSFVGFILGTGTNTAYLERNRLITKRRDLAADGSQAVNVESGNFAKAPRTVIDEDLDASTNNPGTYCFEKMISGAYLGPLGLRLLKAARRARLLTPEGGEVIRALDDLTAVQMDRYLDRPNDPGPLADAALTAGDHATIRRLLGAVIKRAALFAALNMASAVLKSGAGRTPRPPVGVTIDGSTYYKTHGLRGMAERFLGQLLEERGVRAAPVRIQDSPLIGAAIAGLTAT